MGLIRAQINRIARALMFIRVCYILVIIVCASILFPVIGLAQVSSESLLRYYGFRVYTVKLEVPALGVDPLTDVKKTMSLSYHRSFSAQDIIKGERKILAATKSVDLAGLTSRLDQIDAAYKDVIEGDRYTLAYTPGVGTTLLLNDVALVTIPGADFARAYYAMWLGAENPISSGLRERLLEGIGVRA